MDCTGRSGRIFGQHSLCILDGASSAARSEMDRAAGLEHRGGLQFAGGGGGGWRWLGASAVSKEMDWLRKVWMIFGEGTSAAEGDYRHAGWRGKLMRVGLHLMVDVFL